MAKRIIVPKTQKDQDALNFDQEGDFIETELSQEQFLELWNSGVFDEVNALIGTLIDDYEDESVTDLSKIEMVINFFETKKSSNPNTESILELFKKARDLRTGVFFYF